MRIQLLNALLFLSAGHVVIASAVVSDAKGLQERNYGYCQPTTKRVTTTKTAYKTSTRWSKTKTVYKTSTKWSKTTTKWSKTATVTKTLPVKTTSVTKTLPAKTTTVVKSTTLPQSTVTSTAPASTSTITFTEPASTSTVTSTEPASTVTLTEPASISIITLTEPPITTTIATQTTVTATVYTTYPSPDLSCDNQGFAFAWYRNPYTNNDAPLYSDFDVEFFKTAAVLGQGNTTKIGVVADGTEIYGQPVNAGSLSWIALNHRGYLFARETGDYTFIIPYTDDITFMWLGPEAYSAYNRANVDIEQGIPSVSSPPKVVKIALVAGTYYPIRILWGNGQDAASFDFTITAPTGEVIISRDSTTPSPYLVSRVCDSTQYPNFPAFGAETS
ncbi:hypothetical protein TWF730_001032 [Orbilia blumenaviensis]|uniref:PA14 domain-containing protein n=1 Tax=Orbilia blumenaviensis TaxID=1796055 RepID=A0AAV9VQK3_9PEZI